MGTPFFSVIIPTYNRLELLKLTVASVQSQSFTDFELIVVDNCSTDGTEGFIQSLSDTRIRYVRNIKNYERAISRNKGFSLALGKFCTLLDSDDLMYADCLEKVHHFIERNPQAKFIHSFYNIINQQGKKIKDVYMEPLHNPYQQICRGNFISCIGVFMEAEIYKRYRFSEDRRMIGSEDYEIWLRVLSRHTIYRLPIVLCGMREHQGRSVYTDMYLNLEFQRHNIITIVESDPNMKAKYSPYIYLINANYYYHQAMFFFQGQHSSKGLKLLFKTVQANFGIVFRRRFAAMLKSFVFSLRKKTSNRE